MHFFQLATALVASVLACTLCAAVAVPVTTNSDVNSTDFPGFPGAAPDANLGCTYTVSNDTKSTSPFVGDCSRISDTFLHDDTILKASDCGDTWWVGNCAFTIVILEGDNVLLNPKQAYFMFDATWRSAVTHNYPKGKWNDEQMEGHGTWNCPDSPHGGKLYWAITTDGSGVWTGPAPAPYDGLCPGGIRTVTDKTQHSGHV